MTFIRPIFAFLLAAAISATCQAATPTPEEIIDFFFGPSGIADKTDFYTGEMKRLHSNDPTLGERLAPGTTFTMRYLPESGRETPVYAVTLRSGDEAFDWYAYFAPDDVALKLGAVRTLGLSGMPYMLMQALKQQGSRSAEQEWDYQNLHIAFLPDIERLSHFRARLADLDALKAAIDAGDDTIHERMRALHLRGWERNELGQLEIRIGGGLLNNVVGILYVPPDERPPPIDEADHIYIEQIDGPWYVYKTT